MKNTQTHTSCKFIGRVVAGKFLKKLDTTQVVNYLEWTDSCCKSDKIFVSTKKDPKIPINYQSEIKFADDICRLCRPFVSAFT